MTEFSRRKLLLGAAAAALAPAVPSSLVGPSRVFAAPPAPDKYADVKLIDGEPPLPEQGAFTIAVLPDTQNYSESFPDTYSAQTQWIVDNQKARNIACVLHLGDITNHNTPAEWENAHRAMKLLDGKLPYFLVAGNHDYSERGACSDRTTRLNDYFPISGFRDRETFGGVYDKEPDRMENSYHKFSAGGRKFLVLGLEFGPRRDVLRWANEIVGQNKDREVILITHAYMYSDETRYDWNRFGSMQSWNPHSYGVAKATSDDVNDGEELWTGLVSRHENFILTLNGHVLHDGLAHLSSSTPGGREVHQVLVNFQMKPKGGDGWLRLLEFRADGTTVQAYDYSPTRKQRNEGSGNQFAMKLSPLAKA